MTTPDCVSLLTRLDVCADDRRLDHVTLWGVSNPNTTHFYSGGQGYLSFTPTQTSGLATQLVPFFQPSVSFPKPDISRPAFLGSDSNWYLFNFARNTAFDAVTSFRGVPASTFLYEAKTNIVYDPAPKKLLASGALDDTTQQDYDLSSSSPNASRTDVVGTMGIVTGGFDVSNIGVNDGVYYGLRGAAAFNDPYAIAVDAEGNVFVTNSNTGLLFRIDATTQAVTNLGTSASPAFNRPIGVAVDAEGNVFVADSRNGLVRRIDATTQAVTNLGTSASPAFNRPTGVAVDAEGNVFVADIDDSFVRKIDATTQAVTNLGTSASPAFHSPHGVAVDTKGNVFVVDTGHNLVRRIDAVTQAVTNLGTSASPAFKDPYGVAVDAPGNLFIADKGNNLVRRIDATTQAVTSLGTSASPAFFLPRGVAVDTKGNVFVTDSGNEVVRRIDAATQAVDRFVGAPRVLSWDMQSNPDPSSFTLWPETALSTTTINNPDITVVDTAAGGCQNVIPDAEGYCFLLSHAEASPADGRLFLQFHAIKDDAYTNLATIYILDTAQPSEYATSLSIDTSDGGPDSSALLWGVFNTPTNGTVLLTSKGCATDTPDNEGGIQRIYNSRFESLVTAAGTSIVDASAIPSKSPGEPARYLLLTLREKGLNTMYTYDAFTDTIASSNAAAAATTHAMLAFTWGVCDGSVTRGLVELSFSNAYSNECPLPQTGLYYQSPNVYYAIPFACLGIAYDKLLTDCPEIRANMKALVDASCEASIAKVCRQQYDLNPPFSCVTDVYPSALTVISLSSANATTLATFLALVVAALLTRTHRHYRPSEQDIAMVNALQRNHANANTDGKSSGPGHEPGIEMLPSSQTASNDGAAALAAVQSMQSAHKRMEAENAQLHRVLAEMQHRLVSQERQLSRLQEQLPALSSRPLTPSDRVPPPMPSATPQTASTPLRRGTEGSSARLPPLT